jgi:hypothetical protein
VLYLPCLQFLLLLTLRGNIKRVPVDAIFYKSSKSGFNVMRVSSPSFVCVHLPAHMEWMMAGTKFGNAGDRFPQVYQNSEQRTVVSTKALMHLGTSSILPI